jgi:hypothetical protein
VRTTVTTATALSLVVGASVAVREDACDRTAESEATGASVVGREKDPAREADSETVTASVAVRWLPAPSWKASFWKASDWYPPSSDHEPSAPGWILPGWLSSVPSLPVKAMG